MTLLTLVRRSLRYHARSQWGAVAGAAVAAAVILGALLVGDSVRESLKGIALARLGGADSILFSGDRFFLEDLPQRLTPEAPTADTGVALMLEGVASSESGRANRVQVLGMRTGLSSPAEGMPQAGEVWLNDALARQLKVSPGDEIVLRVRKPSALSRDTIITPRSDSSFALRLRFSRVPPASIAGFQLAASQMPPWNAFVALPELQKSAGLEHRANLLLARPSPRTAADLSAALRSHWSLPDAAMDLHEVNPGTFELRSQRIFLDAAVVDSLRTFQPSNSFAVLTYLVNQIRHGDRSTPYSMVTATDGPHVPADLREDEIIINAWLAEDLNLRPGDTLQLTYYVLDSVRSLVEATNAFRVRAIVPLDGLHADRTLMPEFPGLSKAESTHDWDAGFDLVHTLRDKDEAYWKGYRGTPKAFIQLAAGQRLWGNRFGNLTAIRFPSPSAGNQGPVLDRIQPHLRERVDPAALGLRFEPARAQALQAAASGQDFGQLFAGFSFFLVVAALLLMSLLFQFSIERRTSEVGALLALGFAPRQVRRLLMMEGAGLALVGSLLGLAGALPYARLMVHGLNTIWRDAVGTSSLTFHATPATLITGVLAGVCVAWMAMAWSLRRQARQPASQLLAQGSELDLCAASPGGPGLARRVAPWGCAFMALLLVGAALRAEGPAAAGLFFGAGACLLIAGITAFANALRRRTSRPRRAMPHATSTQLALGNLVRRPRRSVAVVALLACGSFLVTSLGVFRLDAVHGASKRGSGTGGFALIASATVPVTQDLNLTQGREFHGLDNRELEGMQVVAMRVREGDDASCLNLNRAQRPRLLGVPPEALASRGAFTFAGAAPGLWISEGWRLLRNPADLEAGIVPAIGDAASIQWALGRKVGDILEDVDETGRPFKLRLVGSIANSLLQGSLLIDEATFMQRFPGISGHRMFLIDAPSDRAAMISTRLTRALSDFGLEVTPAAQRLAAFNAVQNTYLGTFQVLGGLGLLLGSAGLGVVVLRHVLERRGELAVLTAVGFTRPALTRLLLIEHTALLGAGLGLGIVAALLAVLPAAMAPGAHGPPGSLWITLGAVLVNGFLWTWVATALALRGRLLDALRNE
jgi:ABC-type antimicrobial peptide transport system permease subunit